MMSEYLQDPLSEQLAEQLTAYIEQNKATGLNHWLIGDGAFAPHALNQGGLLDWQPVFETAPMNQYEEMGLFVTPLPADAQAVSNLVLWLRGFDGLPMFSIVSSTQSLAEVKALLTWLADAHTDDGLSIYLRVGDSRCLPYIMSSLQQVQREAVASYIKRWMWFGRDGNLDKGVTSKLKTPLPMAQETLSRSFVISEAQYVELVDGGEVDLIYSAIQNNEILFQHLKKDSERYKRLKIVIEKFHAQGVQDLNEMKNLIVQRLFINMTKHTK